MNAFTRPVHVRTDGTADLLQRVTSTVGESEYTEKWLQKTLFAYPETLPITEIDPHSGALVPICMEIRTAVGPADILYVTRTGQLVLVETKLWRNAEARRVAVAQILDYAKELSEWSYEDLARETAIASKGGRGFLLERMRTRYPDLDEAAFIDGINRSLASGDFILIIAGDGIRSGAEALVSFLERYGHLRFHFALVEVASYRLADGSMLLQPRVLAKTELLRRMVYLPSHMPAEPAGELVGEAAASAAEKASQNSAIAERWQRFWTEFLARLALDDEKQAPPPKAARTTNIYFYMPPGSSRAWVTAYVAQAQKEAGVFLSFAKGFDAGPEWYDELIEDREAIEEVVPGLTWEKQADGKVYVHVPPIAVSDIEAPAEREKVLTYLLDQTNRMVNAFRHRLERLAQESGYLTT